MTESEKRKLRVCFTGHRPEKLHMDEGTLHNVLSSAISRCIVEGFTTFITGMARGVDIVAAEIVLKEKKSNPDLRLICALPHPDFEKRWSKDWKERYCSILKKADFVKVVCQSFSMSSYQIRNEWMVNHSSLVIAVYNGTQSGTKNTIEYATSQGIPIRIFRDN